VARLERQVGTKLVDRDPRGLRLTPAGEALVRHTERVLATLAEAEDELHEIAGAARGRVRFGSFTTAAGTIVPGALSALRRERPGLEVTLQITDPPGSVEELRRGDHDLVIVDEEGFGPALDTAGLHVEHLLDDPLLVALPADHPLATRKSLALSALADEDWLLIALPGEPTGDNVSVRAWREAGFDPRVVFVSHDHYAVQGLVAGGMGIALIPALALAAGRSDVVVRPVRGRRPRRRIVAMTQPEPTGATALALDLLRGSAAAYDGALGRAA
jgi:DNA-binding transcriptional LysR family regulator